MGYVPKIDDFSTGSNAFNVCSLITSTFSLWSAKTAYQGTISMSKWGVVWVTPKHILPIAMLRIFTGMVTLLNSRSNVIAKGSLGCRNVLWQLLSTIPSIMPVSIVKAIFLYLTPKEEDAWIVLPEALTGDRQGYAYQTKCLSVSREWLWIPFE